MIYDDQWGNIFVLSCKQFIPALVALSLYVATIMFILCLNERIIGEYLSVYPFNIPSD